MGCDIHIVVERRRKPAERWIGIFSTDCIPGQRPLIAQRNYGFFSAIASVRGRSDYGNYPQNVPEDVSELAWQEYMSAPTDHHSASHMIASEFAKLHHKCNPTASREEFAVYDLLGLDSDEDAEHRVVFWFDN